MSGYQISTRYNERYALSARRKPLIIPAKSAYDRNHFSLLISRIIFSIHFFSAFSILVCMENNERAIASQMISIISPIISGSFMSICVKNGRVIINMIDNRDTFPEIDDATDLYFSHRPNFSRVHLRSDDIVPLEKALHHSAINMLPRVNIQKLSAIRKKIEENIISTLDSIIVFFCHQ
jgi:hypothetical protein